MRFGLRAQLVAAGVVVLAIVTLVTLVLLNSAERRLEEQAFDQLRSVRVAKATSIESEVNEFIGNLDVVARRVPRPSFRSCQLRLTTLANQSTKTHSLTTTRPSSQHA